MGIDIDRLIEAEPTGLNRRIVERLRFLHPMRVRAAMLTVPVGWRRPAVSLAGFAVPGGASRHHARRRHVARRHPGANNKRRHSGRTASPAGGGGLGRTIYAMIAIEYMSQARGNCKDTEPPAILILTTPPCFWLQGGLILPNPPNMRSTAYSGGWVKTAAPDFGDFSAHIRLGEPPVAKAKQLGLPGAGAFQDAAYQ